MTANLIGKRISIPGQFTGLVTIESAKLLENTWLLRVRDRQGELHDAYLTTAEAEEILDSYKQVSIAPVDANQFFLFIESARIKTAYDHDPHFAVSLSGVRPLPHQLEAVYERILPQVRLRFLLADDPGAGKTIMTGLLLKELKLRSAVERVLILAPAPLTLQWQDELRSKFSETFEVVNSVLAKGQLAGNPWERFRQCIASIDFAKRDDVAPGILQVEWDLVIIDEAHKCSARTQGDDLRRTGRYKLAEELSRISERILLLTATPHQGNVDQFHNFLRLLDPEQFISDKLNPQMLSLEDSPWFLRRIKEELVDFNGRKLFRKRYPLTVPFDLSEPEKYLYDQVTKYINKYLGKQKGRKQAAVALARTVLQRRLASSLNAIFNSLKKRQQRFADLLEELEDLSPAEQRQRLINLGKPVDSEVEIDDVEEEELEDLAVESTVAEQLDQLREELRELERLVKLTQQTISRVAYLGTALVHPGSAILADCPEMRNDPEVEAFAMEWVMNYERDRGWQPQDISKAGDGSGFDIRSIGPADPDTKQCPVRRIEVKGRTQLNQPVMLTVNEWRKAQQLGDSYWLYVVWGCKTPNPQLLMIQNPAKKLVGDAKEIQQVTRYLVGAEALVRWANG